MIDRGVWKLPGWKKITACNYTNLICHTFLNTAEKWISWINYLKYYICKTQCDIKCSGSKSDMQLVLSFTFNLKLKFSFLYLDLSLWRAVKHFSYSWQSWIYYYLSVPFVKKRKPWLSFYQSWPSLIFTSPPDVRCLTNECFIPIYRVEGQNNAGRYTSG